MTTVIVEIVAEACIFCGVVFGLSVSHKKELQKTGATFCCPNGHKMAYNNSLEEQIKNLKTQLSQEQKTSEYWRKSTKAEEKDHALTKRRLASTKSQLTKTKKRVGNGVCPCCNRHFTNLERHMHSKHPDYLTKEE